MKYVLDASVALKWVLPEQDSDKANQVRDDYRNGLHELLAPDIFSVEVAHVLSKAERQGILNQGDGAILLADVITTLPRLFSSLSLLPRAYTIASMERLSLYDCLYLALAEQQQCELLTADSKLLRALPAHPIVHISSLASPRLSNRRGASAAIRQVGAPSTWLTRQEKVELRRSVRVLVHTVDCTRSRTMHRSTAQASARNWSRK